MQRGSRFVLCLIAAMLGLTTAVWVDNRVRAATNGYVGSEIYGQGWWIAVMFAAVGCVGYLLGRKLRRVGLGLIVLAISFGLALMMIAHVFPYGGKPTLQPAVRGLPVRILFRPGTTGKQENMFLCQFVYKECTPAGHDSPPEIISITRTDSNELTISTTTAEFQAQLLNAIKDAPIVQSVQGGFNIR